MGLLFFGTLAHASIPYAANNILGQPDFTTSDPNCFTTPNPKQNLMCQANGTALDSSHHRLFVADASYNRILVYDLTNGIANGMNASYVLGQPDFVSSTANLTQNGLNNLEGIAYDNFHNDLIVADVGANRVLVFNFSNGISNGMNASYVLGQPDFVTSSPTSCDKKSFCTQPPRSVTYDNRNNRLFVANGYSRISIFDFASGVSNNMDASFVLGEPDFTNATSHCTQNGNATFCESWGMAYDEVHNRIFIADNYDNNRILVFDLSNGITNGMAASWELGQPDFNTDNCNYGNPVISAASLCEAFGVVYDAVNDRLFAYDSVQRYLIYNTTNLTNGMNASVVFGQTDFTSGSHNACPALSNTIICRGFTGYPSYDSGTGTLFVPADGRVLIFKLTHISNSSLGNGNIGSPFNQTIVTSGGQGTQSFSITAGNLPSGLSLNPTTGLISGSPSVLGTFTFSITNSDNNAAAGILTDTKQFTITILPGAPNTGFILANSNPIITFTIVSSVSLLIYFMGQRLKRRDSS